MNIDSVLAKIQRAEEHAKALKDAIGAWRQSGGQTLTAESNGDATRHSIRTHFAVPPDTQRWGLIMGDALNNLRCSLDHLVYSVAAVIHNPVPTDIERNCNFPRCSTPQNFAGRVCFLPSAVRDVIEGFQPYNRGHAISAPLLAVLQDLNNTDKHRAIKPAVVQSVQHRMNFKPGVLVKAGSKPPVFEVNTGDLKDGDEIVSVTFDVPQPNLEFEFNATFGVVI